VPGTMDSNDLKISRLGGIFLLENFIRLAPH